VGSSKHSEPRDAKLTHIELVGFYITPFDQKTIHLDGTGATKGIAKTVDFNAVITTVKDAITSQSVTRGDIEYSFTLTTHQIRAKYLDESIMQNIDNADFVVVDWTTANHNVLDEAGYARGRGKHGIHLTADGSLPSDKAGIIHARYEPENPGQLATVIPELLPDLVKRIEEGPRVFDFYDTRSPNDIDRMIKNSKREICVLQTNLETVNANHLASLASALERGVSLRILTLDPQSRYVNERALQLGYKTATIRVYRNSLQTAIDNTAAQLQGHKGWRIRLYNDFPTQLTYIFDDHILVSTMSRTGRSRDNCVFVLPTSRMPGPQHTFTGHFEKLWEQADQEIEPQA
jgi:hypothetical protein